MSHGFIRLEWEVPKRGFRILTRPHIVQRTGSSILTGEDTGRGHYLEPIGEEMKSYSLGLLERIVFLELANIEDSEQSVLAFVNKWGQLTKADNTLEDVIWAREQLRKGIVKALNEGISALAKTMRPKTFIRALDVGFRRVPGRSAPEICYYVRDLRSFCWLEMLQALAGPTDILQCKRCKGLIRRPKAGPEPDYCSSACKQAAYRQRIREKR